MADFSKIGKSNVRRSKAHERRVAKLLKEWSGIEFRRRRTEGREADTVDIDRTADVIPCVPEWTRFSIEAKCGDWGTLDSLMSNPKGTKLTEWWHQANYDAGLATKTYEKLYSTKEPIYPMVFFKPHPNFDWVMFSDKSLKYLEYGKNGENCVGRCKFPHLYFGYYGTKYCGPISHNISHTKNKNNAVYVELELDGAIICRWKDFAANVDPKRFFIKWPAVAERKTES